MDVGMRMADKVTGTYAGTTTFTSGTEPEQGTAKVIKSDNNTVNIIFYQSSTSSPVTLYSNSLSTTAGTSTLSFTGPGGVVTGTVTEDSLHISLRNTMFFDGAKQ